MSTAAPQSTTVGRDRIVTVALIIVCQSFQALSFGGIALFLPIIRKDLDLSFTQAGMLSATSTAVYAAMQLPSGYLADRFSPKRLFFIGLLGATTLSFTFALVQEYWQALANQGMSGIFRALLFAPGLTLLAGWFPPHRRATAMGLFTIGAFSGNVVLDLAGPFFVGLFGWRLVFLGVSAAGIGMAFVYARFGKEAVRSGPRRQVSMAEALRLFRYRAMWVCGVIQYVRLSVVTGIGFWLPTLLVEERGLSLQVAGAVVAMGAALTAPSNTVGGYVSDRVKNPPLVIGLSLAVLAVTAVLLAIVGNLALLIVVIAVNAVFVQFYFGPLFAVAVEMLGPRTAGTSTGISNFFANVGSFTFAYLLGVIKDATGAFATGFYVIAGVCVVGLAFTVLLARMRRSAVTIDHR